MTPSREVQAARAQSLQQQRQALLQELARVNREMAATREQLHRLEERIAALAPASAKAA